MKFPTLKLSIVALSMVFFTASMMVGTASANMTVSPMKMSVGGESNAPGVIRVFSKSEETQYIKVYVKRVLDPAMPDEREEDAVAWNGKELVVSPAKFALPAGASRAVRVINFAPPEKEEVYRVYFEGVDAPQDDDSSGNAGDRGAKVSVNVVWGALVRARPAKAAPDFKRVGNMLHNTGNTRIAVSVWGKCTGPSDDVCAWQPIEKSVFPGGTLALPAEASTGPIRLKFQVDGVRGTQVKDLSALD